MSDTFSGDPKAELVAELRRSLAQGTFVRLVLGKWRGDGAPRACEVTQVALKEGMRLRCVTTLGRQTFTENRDIDAAAIWLAGELGAGCLSATLLTTVGDTRLIYSRKRVPQLSRSRATVEARPSVEHNRAKAHAVDPARPFLAELGITHGQGQVKPSMYGKYRQICRFVEIFDQLLAESELNDRPSISVVDIGAGKGYLTFAVHEHLARDRGRTATTLGIEAQAELAAAGTARAQRLGMTGLRFEAAVAQSVAAAPLDVLIALHACDTATDDALQMGVVGGAGLILAAPCCQHEIAPQLRAAGSPLQGLLRYGLLLQRQADLVTDAARALLLEASGYKVRVIDFVSTEHTAKNLLLAAVRSKDVDRREALRQYRALKQALGFATHHLEQALSERLAALESRG